MYWPFAVFALPRSRTFWLSRWLEEGAKAAGIKAALVGHDLAIEADSPQDWLNSLWFGRLGSVETGATGLGTIARRAMGEARIVVIRRPVEEVAKSLGKFIFPQGLTEELTRRDRQLDQLVAEGATEVAFGDLASPDCCAWLFEYLTGLPFDFSLWQLMSRQNLQIDVPASLARQQERSKEIDRFFLRLENALARPTTKFSRVGLEPWDSFWPEAKDWMAQHGPGEWDPDEARLGHMARTGQLLVCSARTNGRLVGYCFWTLGNEFSDRKIRVASQGPLYAAPGTFGIGKKLVTWATASLPRLGFRKLTWQHNLEGRGNSLGKHLLALDAVPTKQIWTMEIPDG